jgi:ribosomal protein S18 acetylase RimI-like enzyme
MTDVSFDTAQLQGVTFEPMSRAVAETLAPLLANIDPWARYAYTVAALASFLATEEADGPRYAIAVDRAIAGAVSIRKNWLRGPYLQFLGILPPYQNHGIGSSVLNWFENEARETRAQNLWVAASEFNVRALSFYEKHGYGRVAVLTDLVVEGSSEILLRKRLSHL